MELPKKTIHRLQKQNEKYNNPGVKAAWDYIERKSKERKERIIMLTTKICYFFMGFFTGILLCRLYMFLMSILTK